MSEKDKESLIKKEKSRLRKVFSEIDPNKLKIIKPLIERAAFMTVSCEELEKIIAEKGYTEAYQNGENQKSFHLHRLGKLGSYPQLGLIAFIQSWSTYQQQAAVWISTLKN